MGRLPEKRTALSFPETAPKPTRTTTDNPASAAGHNRPGTPALRAGIAHIGTHLAVPTGALACPWVLSPQHTTVSSVRSPQLWYSPTVTAL